MDNEKKIEKYLQTRYKRELERYLNRMVNFAKQPQKSREDFDAYETKMREKLRAAQKRDLHSSYYTQLEDFVDKVEALRNGEGAMDDIADTILHEANKIRKAKRKRSYNRKGLKHDSEY